MSGHPALTARQVAAAILALIDADPEAGDWPVHLLDMEDEAVSDEPWAGLVTRVEGDCFDADLQGPVVSLLAWHTAPEGL